MCKVMKSRDCETVSREIACNRNREVWSKYEMVEKTCNNHNFHKINQHVNMVRQKILQSLQNILGGTYNLYKMKT
ncbi:CLUMA_CG013269, isoform A [Clunio marinus]|uniref:CLUMA_CG013269, isoform A n=1 Tax=Clunio marinus TaxID=568069 RepID=A0A1J1ILM3_9DIPT|nr:CLUMA_CG013269, isoform A [Clunio marinus]